MDARPTPEHIYHSTGCLHTNHEHCYNDHTISGKPKKPHACKFCEAECICPCHRGIDVRALTPEQMRTLTLTTIVETFVGKEDHVDFQAIETVMATLERILLHAGNPWGDGPAPAAVSGAVEHGRKVVDYLRELQ